MLKNTKEKEHKWFDAVKEKYGKVLAFCLKHKAIPLGVALVLFAFCVFMTGRMGLVLMEDSESDQIMVTLTLDTEIEKDAAYETADEVMEKIAKVEGVKKVAVMDGNATTATSFHGKHHGQLHKLYVLYYSGG